MKTPFTKEESEKVAAGVQVFLNAIRDHFGGELKERDMMMVRATVSCLLFRLNAASPGTAALIFEALITSGAVSAVDLNMLAHLKPEGNA